MTKYLFLYIIANSQDLSIGSSFLSCDTIKHMFTEKISPLLVNGLLIIALIILSVFIMTTASSILIPLCIGIFLTLFIYPLSRKLVAIKIPKSIALFLAGCITFIISGAVVMGIGILVKTFIATLPSYADTVNHNVLVIQQFISTIVNIPVQSQLDYLATHAPVAELASTYIPKILSGVTSLFGTLGLSIIFSVFILAYRHTFKKFILSITAPDRRSMTDTIFKKANKLIPHYLFGMMLSIGVLAVLNCVGFAIIGVPQPIFWGVVTALLNIIPYVGTLFGFISVIIFSFFTAGPITAAWCIALFMIIQFIDNNITTPFITGRGIQINPLASILGIIILGNIWGIAGMILALPILGIIKIMADHIPELHPIKILISNE